LIVFFAALLGFAFSPGTGSIALDVPSAIASDNVTICHVPQGQGDNPRTITPNEQATNPGHGHEVGAHGGDYMGECETPCECLPGIASCVCSDGTDGTPGSTGPGSVSPPSSQRNLHGQ
jgi:hypothetical protein